MSSLRKLLFTAVLFGLLQSDASAGDLPPPATYVEVEIEYDTGKVIDAHLTKSTGNPALDEATLKEIRKWRFKPGKLRRATIPIPLAKGRKHPLRS